MPLPTAPPSASPTGCPGLPRPSLPAIPIPLRSRSSQFDCSEFLGRRAASSADKKKEKRPHVPIGAPTQVLCAAKPTRALSCVPTRNKEGAASARAGSALLARAASTPVAGVKERDAKRKQCATPFILTINGRKHQLTLRNTPKQACLFRHDLPATTHNSSATRPRMATGVGG